ncbi:MAG: SDR family NAD(P)-dependent oxidoreductase [Bdellovibrionales bacterium]
MSARNVVIVGGNRGIGLELCRQYKAAGDNVFCMCRSASSDLKDLGVSVVEGFDVVDDEVVTRTTQEIEIDIDILIHNAGILEGDRFPEIDLDSMRRQFEVNSLGPLKTVLALKSKMKVGSKVGIVSSRVGSIADNSSSNNYGYRTSKTAVNMISKCLALDLKERDVSLRILHPGYVKTEMTGGNGNILPDEAARGLITQMDSLSLENTGQFFHANGESLPW